MSSNRSGGSGITDRLGRGAGSTKREARPSIRRTSGFGSNAWTRRAALAAEFVSAIEEAAGEAVDQALEDALAAAIDEAVALAIEEGISKAAIEAGIAAYLAALAAGKSEAQALAEGEAACGC